MRMQREVEAAFEVAADAALPALTGVPGLAAVRSEAPITLVAQYWDTADLGLLRAGATLRRRTGGSDDGWHLKLPGLDPADPHTGSRSRDEHRTGLIGDHPPDALLGLVRARLHGRPVAPVAEVTTARTVHHLLDPDGREAVEVADDRVRGRVLGPAARETGWHEWEAELKDGRPEQLVAVLGRLAAAAGTGPRAAGKVARTFGGLVPAPVSVRPRDGTAGEAARAEVARWTQVLLTLLPVALTGDEDAVHDARTATRRLRAALRLQVLDADATAHAREGLRDLGRALGAVRDPQVERRGLSALALAEPDPDVPAVRGALQLLVADRDLAGRQGLERVTAWLSSPAADAAFAALAELADRQATGQHAGRAARTVLARATRRSHRAAAAAWADAVRPVRAPVPGAGGAPRAGPSPAHDDALHAARRAARRARYTADLAALTVGPPAGRSAARYRRLQEALGEQHDAVLRRATLAALAYPDPTQAFVAGRWHARLEAVGERAERDAARAAHRVLAHGHRRWMRA